MGQKIAVIGGSGFIGTQLVSLLLIAGHEIRIFDKVPSKQFPDLWTWVDVRELPSLLETLIDFEIIYNLAAEHQDDVRPVSLYTDVNVGGAKNICIAAEKLTIKHIIFTSSVAVYGFAEPDVDESGTLLPFNEYGRTKLLAEGVFQEWQRAKEGRKLMIVRPTVVFGEGNRGNVYNLLLQLSKHPTLMVGPGKNIKSLAYVKNVAAFLTFIINLPENYNIFNYVDKPDYTMNELLNLMRKLLNTTNSKIIRIPYALVILGCYFLDLISNISKKRFSISKIRVQKFCSFSQFQSNKAFATGFAPPYLLVDGLERTIQSVLVGE